MRKEILNNTFADKTYDILGGFKAENISNTEYINVLEKRLTDYYKKDFALTFTNATQAIFFLCLALELKNSAILTTPFTWGGSIAPLLFFNNMIYFMEFSFDNYCLNPQKLINKIPRNLRAILSVDYCGNPADTKSLKKYCDENNLLLISDSSQSFGAYFDDRPAGLYADVIIISFGQGKPLYGGEGGAIITSNEDLYKSLIWLSQHPQKQKRYFGLSYLNQFGLNGRMNPLAAMLIVSKWNEYIANLKKRQIEYFNYYEYLSNHNLVKKKRFLKNLTNSTFFIPIFELKKDTTTTDIEKITKKYKLSREPLIYKIELINEDSNFIKYYSHLSNVQLSEKFIAELNSKNYIYVK